MPPLNTPTCCGNCFDLGKRHRKSGNAELQLYSTLKAGRSIMPIIAYLWKLALKKLLHCTKRLNAREARNNTENM